MMAVAVIAAVCWYSSIKERTLNSVPGLWLSWGLPYLNTILGTGPTQSLKDIDNNSRSGHQSSQSSKLSCFLWSAIEKELKTCCSSVAGNKLNIGIEEMVTLPFSD